MIKKRMHMKFFFSLSWWAGFLPALLLSTIHCGKAEIRDIRLEEIDKKPAHSLPKKTDKIMLNKKELEQIRVAVIDYFRQSKHELKEKFIQELIEGAIFIGTERFNHGEFSDIDRSNIDQYGRIPGEKIVVMDGDMVSIGAWRLENDDLGWILKRYGELRPGAAAIFDFGVRLQKEATGWRAIGDFYEHIRVGRN